MNTLEKEVIVCQEEMEQVRWDKVPEQEEDLVIVIKSLMVTGAVWVLDSDTGVAAVMADVCRCVKYLQTERLRTSRNDPREQKGSKGTIASFLNYVICYISK